MTIVEGHHNKVQNCKEPIAPRELEDVGPDLVSLPTFPASQVYIGTRYTTGFSAFEAFIQGEQYVCEIISYFYRVVILSELGVLFKIYMAILDREARTSRHKGSL